MCTLTTNSDKNRKKNNKKDNSSKIQPHDRDRVLSILFIYKLFSGRDFNKVVSVAVL